MLAEASSQPAQQTLDLAGDYRMQLCDCTFIVSAWASQVSVTSAESDESHTDSNCSIQAIPAILRKHASPEACPSP